MASQTGIGKWFNEGKGFGFIAPGGKCLFAHDAEAQRVEFDVTQGKKGPQAPNIRPLA